MTGIQVLIIAHRQEMVLMADRIVSLEGGKLQDHKVGFLVPKQALPKDYQP